MRPHGRALEGSISFNNFKDCQGVHQNNINGTPSEAGGGENMGRAFSGPHISRNHISINNMEIRRKEQYGGMDFSIGTGPTRGRNHPTGSNNTGHTQGAPSGSWNGFQNNHNWEQQKQPKQPNGDRPWGSEDKQDTTGESSHSPTWDKHSNKVT